MIYFQGLAVSFLDAFAKFRKAAISFVISVSLSVCLSVRLEQQINVRIFFENLQKIQI